MNSKPNNFENRNMNNVSSPQSTSYPHAYLNPHANGNIHQPNSHMYLHNYNNFPQSYNNNFNNHHFHNFNQQMTPQNFNFYQNPNYHMQPFAQGNSYPTNINNRHFNNSLTQSNTSYHPYNRNNNQYSNSTQRSHHHQANKNKFFNGNNKNNDNCKNKNKNKNDLPENNKYYCESCDRGFKFEDKYAEHCLTHKTCNVNGCKFTAAAKLVEIHFKNFHASGLDKKVSNLHTPEEIQSYINERKKNFPSNKNLENKTKLEDEKSNRGVVLNTQQFGRLNKRKHGHLEKENQNNSSFSNEKESLSPNLNNSKNKFKKRRNKKNSFQKKNNTIKYEQNKPTLLQKLLADEIRHERNIILQCVRYVVENNFFEEPTKNVLNSTTDSQLGKEKDKDLLNESQSIETEIKE